MADTNPVLQAANNASRTNAAAASATQTLTDQSAELSNLNANIVTSNAINDSIIRSTELNSELSRQNARLKIGDIFNTNVNSQSEAYSALSSTAQSAYMEKMAALDEIKRKQSVSFFDNPLEWLTNRFTINSDIDTHNNADAKQEAATKRIADLNASTQATVVTNNQFTNTVTEATIDANTKKIQSLADIQANLSKRQGIADNITGVQASLAASKEELQIRNTVFAAQTQAENQKIALRQLALHEQSNQLAIQNHALALEKFGWEREKIADEKAFNESLVGVVNKGRLITQGPNAPMLDPTAKEAKMIVQLMKGGGAVPQEVQEAYRAGLTGIVAPTVGQVIDYASKQSLYFKDSQKVVQDFLGTVVQDTQKAAIDPQNGDLKKDAAARGQFQTAVAGKKLDEMLKEIKPGDPSNIFNIPSIKNILGVKPELQKLPAIAKVIVPVIGTGADLTADQVLTLTAKALRDREITSEQAREVNLIFKAGVDLNLADKDLIKFALVPSKEVPRSYKTKVTLDNNALFGGKEVINLIDDNAWLSAIGKRAAEGLTYKPAPF